MKRHLCLLYEKGKFKLPWAWQKRGLWWLLQPQLRITGLFPQPCQQERIAPCYSLGIAVRCLLRLLASQTCPRHVDYDQLRPRTFGRSTRPVNCSHFLPSCPGDDATNGGHDIRDPLGAALLGGEMSRRAYEEEHRRAHDSHTVGGRRARFISRARYSIRMASDVIRASDSNTSAGVLRQRHFGRASVRESMSTS